MKHIRLIIILLIGVVAAGCTHNNGDIGPLFGKWKVTSIVAEGITADPYQGNVFWDFQSHTISVSEQMPNHDYSQGFGNWSMSGDELTIDFPDETRQPPAASLLPSSCRLQVLKLNTGHAIFLLHRADGATITFTLKKW